MSQRLEHSLYTCQQQTASRCSSWDEIALRRLRGRQWRRLLPITPYNRRVNHTEVAIAGGGIIGLSAALELAAAGLQVTVFERGRAMAESSGAAAGMLAAKDRENPTALRGLAELSRRLYPQFLAEVERLSGERIPIRTTQAIQGMRRLPRGFEALGAAELQALAPGAVVNGLSFFSLDEESLDPRDLARALPKAVRATGVILIEETAVTGVSEQSGQVTVTTSAGDWNANHFLHASGAWTARLTGIPISPRKGQMAVVEDSGPNQLKVVLRTPEIYLVPRGDGRIVIGATVEDVGFDKRVDDAAIARLLDTAAELWPQAQTARIVESWAGLRPATPDELPVIDACGWNCWVAAGHFRNGILLAPATAHVLCELITMRGEAPGIDLTPFRCGRFAASAVHC
jgi:glycine oxidase